MVLAEVLSSLHHPVLHLVVVVGKMEEVCLVRENRGQDSKFAVKKTWTREGGRGGGCARVRNPALSSLLK